MFIYVSGPYSPPAGGAPELNEQAIATNVKRANAVALLLVGAGHAPFVPHTMMFGWEDRDGVPRDLAMRVCREWVTRCDAIFVIGSSPGADMELEVAEQHGLAVYRSLEEVPPA
jgi:Domain of unknown function (DUF4406)